MGLKRTILEKVNGYSILIRPSSAAQPQGLKERHGMNWTVNWAEVVCFGEQQKFELSGSVLQISKVLLLLSLAK